MKALGFSFPDRLCRTRLWNEAADNAAKSGWKISVVGRQSNPAPYFVIKLIENLSCQSSTTTRAQSVIHQHCVWSKKMRSGIVCHAVVYVKELH